MPGPHGTRGNAPAIPRPSDTVAAATRPKHQQKHHQSSSVGPAGPLCADWRYLHQSIPSLSCSSPRDARGALQDSASKFPLPNPGQSGSYFFLSFCPTEPPHPASETPTSHHPHTPKDPPHQAVEILSGLPFGPISPRTREAPDSALIRAALSLSHIPDGFCRGWCKADFVEARLLQSSSLATDGRCAGGSYLFRSCPLSRVGSGGPSRNSTPFVSTTFAWIWDGGKTLYAFGFLSCSFSFWTFLLCFFPRYPLVGFLCCCINPNFVLACMVSRLWKGGDGM